MKPSRTIRPANVNEPTKPQAILLLGPVIDILARQAARAVKPANDNGSAGASSDLQ